MRHSVWLCAAFLCASAEPARAAIEPADCTVPPFIRIVGTSGNTQNNNAPDPTGAYVVIVSDGTSPISGAVVRLRFAECRDMRLCSVQGPASVNCDAVEPWVETTTDMFGTARFVVLGAGLNPGAGTPGNCAGQFPGPGLDCVRVVADDLSGAGFVEIGRATAIHYDMNGAATDGIGNNGVQALDLSILKNEIGFALFGCGYKGRNDLSADGAVTAVDLSFHKTVVGNSGLGVGSAGGCSSSPGPGVVIKEPYCP